MPTCSTCGERSPAGFRFCGHCGVAFDEAPSLLQVRRTVTIVYSDLQGSTELGEQLECEALREVIALYYEAMSEVLLRHGGTLEKFVGDAVIAVFGLPVTQEDDPVRAVRAAMEMVRRLESLNERLEQRFGVRLVSRTGVNTGEVVTGKPEAGQRVIVGDVVNTAARLEAAAPPMGVLIGAPTWDCVRDAAEAEPVEPLRLKGKAEPVPAYLVRRIGAGEGVRRRHDQPLSGREVELAALRSALERSLADGRVRTVTVVGEAGIGKSRLVEELGTRLPDGARMLQGRCLSYGNGITFWPLREIVREAAAIRDEDPTPVAMAKLEELTGEDGAETARRVGSAIGLVTDAFAVEEIFWAFRKLLEGLAAEQPLVVVFDDLHWAESALLELIEHLAAAARAPLLLVCLTRPELLESRPGWLEGTAPRLVLEPLTAAEVGMLLDRQVGGAGLVPHLRDRLVAAADGNPLFAGQLLAMLVERGDVVARGGRWRAAGDLDRLELPPTVEALLAARIDRLTREEREVLEAASVVGAAFAPQALEAMLDGAVAGRAREHLATLARRQLITSDPQSLAGEGGMRFQHALVREAAYRRVLKRRRAELHERFVAWADRVDAQRDREIEYEEILGYHLERAYCELAELGPADEHARRLAARAVERLVPSGHRAMARGDAEAAADLLRRSSALLPERDPERLIVLTEAGEASTEMGDFAAARSLLDEAARLAAETGDRAVAARARLMQLQLATHEGEPGALAGRCVAEVEKLLGELESLGDHEGLATAYRLLAWAHGTTCRYGAAAEAAERAMAHAEAAGDERRRRRAASHYAVAALWGPTPVEEAAARCLRTIGQAETDRHTLGLVKSVLARLEAMRGRQALAARMSRDARQILRDGGRTVLAASTSLDSCGVAMLAGDPARAEHDLRLDLEALQDMNEQYLLPTVAAELGRALAAQGRDAEAASFSEMAERLAAEDDVATQALWRSVRAAVWSRRGQHREALALADEAVALLRATDSLVAIGDALLVRADVLVAAGRAQDALRDVDEAEAAFRRKGDVVSAARARRTRAELTMTNDLTTT